MATTNTIAESSPTSARPTPSLLVVLPVLQQGQIEHVLDHLQESLPAEELLVATPETPPQENYPAFQFTQTQATKSSWTLTASDFVNAYQLAQKSNVKAILMLGQKSESLRPAGLRDLANAVALSSIDLAVPRYDLPPRAGLVNSAILYPLNRTAFASRIRFPLAIDFGLSMRMAEKLAMLGQRYVALNQSDVPLWVVSEAAVHGYHVEEVDVGPRELPQPAEPDLNAVLPYVTSSLFADVEARAAFWQRPRQTPPPHRQLPIAPSAPTDSAAEVASIVQGFRLAYTNLQEIWSLVLPPNSLIVLKRLSQAEAAAFKMPDNVWARIVFDFLVAYRLRSINRGHLLGALIPLYLAWVASHINSIAAGANPERQIEGLAAAFEADKAYLVARWRWPDRFNP